MECRRGEQGDKTCRHIAVKLSISLFHSHAQFFSFRHAVWDTLRPDTPVYLNTISANSYLHVFFFSHYSHTTQTVAPSLSRTNTDLIHASMFTSWRQQNSLKAVSEIRALSLLFSLNTHCLHTIGSAQFVCAALCEGSSSPSSSRLQTKPLLLAWDDQWFTCYLWPMQPALQTFFFHTHMHSCGRHPPSQYHVETAIKSYP